MPLAASLGLEPGPPVAGPGGRISPVKVGTGARPIVALEDIDRAILLLRGQKVLLDSDLASLYGVTAKSLNQAVRRNPERFPLDFMFELTAEEARLLRSQTVTLKLGRGHHRKYRPYAFTDQGVAMLSSVLRSPRAVRVNVEIMRAFVRLRRLLESNAGLASKLDALEAKHDSQFKFVFEAIRELMIPPERVRRRIGFGVPSGQHARRP